MFGDYKIKDFEDFDLTVSTVDFALTKRCPLNFTFKSISRQLYGLVFIVDGKAEFVFSDETILACKDDVVFLKKGESYQFDARGDTNLEYVVISFDISPCKYIDFLPLSRVNKPVHSKRLEELFKNIEDLWYLKIIGYKFQARSLVQILIYELMLDKFNQAAGSKVLQNIQAPVQYMQNYFDQSVDIDTLATMSGYSQTHFRRKFKEIYGIPPAKYLNNIRVQKAKDMLKSNLYTTEEIAFCCGFRNVHYFSKVFKKITGYTPRSY